jgi:hypothetical protein
MCARVCVCVCTLLFLFPYSGVPTVGTITANEKEDFLSVGGLLPHIREEVFRYPLLSFERKITRK